MNAITRSPAGRQVCGGASVAESNSNSTATGMQRSTANKRTVQLTAEQQHKPGPQRRTRLHDVGSKVVVSGALVALGHPCEAHAVPKPGKHAAEGRQAGRQADQCTQTARLGCMRGMCSPTECSRAAGQQVTLEPTSAPHLQLVFVASPHQNSTWWNLCMGKRSVRGLWRCTCAAVLHSEQAGDQQAIPTGMASRHSLRQKSAGLPSVHCPEAAGASSKSAGR